MEQNRQSIIYLSTILLLATLLRLAYLQTIPMGFNCDEAVTGYESYSILETLRDRYGKFLPLFVRVMGDYRPSLYIFIAIPFVKIFGLNEFATRLPAAISGIITVFLVYLLAKKIFNPRVALVAALLLAVNPWYIHFNRIAYEVNLLPLFFCLGLWLFFESFTKPNYLILSAISFGVSLNTYQSARVFVPLFMISTGLIFYQHFLSHKKQTIFSLIAFVIIFIPLFRFWISPEGMARANQVGVDSGLQIILNYLSFFNPNYLFFHGSADLQVNPTVMGCFYQFELITVLLGLFYLIFKGNREQRILLLWLALYPIPAAFVDTALPTRSLVAVPLFAIISSCGLIQLLDFLGSRFNLKFFLWFAAVVVIINVSIFSQRYFTNYPSDAAMMWKYGMREAISYAEKNSYNCIVLSSDRNSSCFALHDFIAHIPFYTKYPPLQYQRSPIEPWIRGSRDKVYVLGKYQLLSIAKQPKLNEKCLFIIRPDEIQEIAKKSSSWRELTTITDAHGVAHFKLIEVVNNPIQ